MEKITFSANVSDFVRTESVFRFGQKVTTENGRRATFIAAGQRGKVKWYDFNVEGQGRVEFRMMRFPMLSPMNLSREHGDTVGLIDLRNNLLVTINRKMARLLK